MAYQLPIGFSFVGTTPAAAPGAATNQYGFAADSLNFAPASSFQTWNAATIAANKAAAAPVATPAAPVTPVAAMPAERTMPIVQAPEGNSLPYVPPVTTPAPAPTTYTLPPGFSFKTPVAPAPAPPVVQPPVITPPPPPVVQPPVVTPPPPVVQPPAPVVTPPVVAKPVTPPVAGPVTPPVVKAPVVTTPKPAPAPAPVDPRVAALKNQGYTDAQIAAAGGAAALLAKVNAPKSGGTTTAAVNYPWADLNQAVTALQKANPSFSVQGMPVTKWSTAGVASLAKTDPAIFKALSAYLPKY